MDNGYLPWLSLATAAFEIAAAVWVITGPGRRGFVRFTALLLVVLAGYQLAEVWVCANPDHVLRSQLAFCDIIWLPSLSISLLCQIHGGAPRWVRVLLRLSYVYCGGVCVWVLTHPEPFIGTICSTVLATFQRGSMGFQLAFGGFYEATMFAMLVGAAAVMKRNPDPIARAHAADLQIGSIGFIVPALLTQVVWRSLDPSLPSLMCHYALVLAIFLVRASLRERRSRASTPRG